MCPGNQFFAAVMGKMYSVRKLLATRSWERRASKTNSNRGGEYIFYFLDIWNLYKLNIKQGWGAGAGAGRSRVFLAGAGAALKKTDARAGAAWKKS